MTLDQLQTFFDHNPAAKLLASPHSAYVVYFLHQHFKAGERLATPHSELAAKLGDFLDRVHETQAEVMQQDAETYLTKWTTGDTRWLGRFYDAQHKESIYQLTPQTEDVLEFLTKVLERTISFVGTESRLTRIIETLSDIVVRGSDDPERRLKFLRAERQRIDDEIASIEAGDAVSTHTPTALRERFNDVVTDLVSLQGDFRAVEESFKTITRDVQKQQIESDDSRGDILHFALDAEDRLKQDDQGASFQAFVGLILSQSKQEELERNIRQLDEIAELASQIEGKRRVKDMIRILAAEAEKVSRTTRRLSSTLRRLLDSRTSAARRRLAQVLREIKTQAAQRAEAPPAFGMDIYTELDLVNVSQREFWQSPVQFDEVAITTDEPSEDDRLLAFRDLAAMHRLDWDAMRGSIARLLHESGDVTLPELLEASQATASSIEVLAYLQIAHDDGHHVDENVVDVVSVADPDTGAIVAYETPRVVFINRHPEFAEGGRA